MFSPSEGLASKAWIIVLGWSPSRERPLAVENLMVQGVVGLEGSGSLFAIDLLALLGQRVGASLFLPRWWL